MHEFAELIIRSTTFTLATLREANKKTIEALQSSGATSLLKTLQMIQLQKAILAVGIFSIFEAILQEELQCADGFLETRNLLESAGQEDLRSRFEDLYLAINVLKHGCGRSYNTLVAKAATLPFRVKLPDEHFFLEGDVSEVSTLVEVDDAFVQYCCNIVSEVSNEIRRVGRFS